MNGVTVQHKNSSHDHNVHLNLQFISFRLYMESIQFIFWLYMENVCVYHVSSFNKSCFCRSSNLSIVLFSLELCGIRLICASSLRFNQGFCMEWIKYQHNKAIISQTPPPTIFVLFYVTYNSIKKGKGGILQDVVKLNPQPFKIQGLNIVYCVSELISSSGLPSPQHLKMQMGTCND